MSLRSELSKIIRGYKLICEIDKFYLILQVINAFTDSLFPFVYLYMSSKIITELSTYRRARELIIYALVTVSINFVLSVFSQCINTIKSKHSELFTCRTALFYSDINNKMRYESIEDPETHFKRQSIIQNQQASSAGIPMLINDIYGFIKNTFTVIFSLSLTVSMFYLYSDKSCTGVAAFVNSPFSIIIIVGIVAVNTCVNIWCDKNHTLRSVDAWKDLPHNNRLLNYYSGRIWNYNGAMDIRIFNQEAVISKELSKYYDNPAHLKILVKLGLHFGTIRTLLNKFTTIAIYIYVGIKAYIGAFGVGNFLMYTGSLQQFTYGVSGLCGSVVSLFNNNRYMQEIFEYMDIPSTVNQGSRKIDSDAKREIEFRNVSFKYPGTDVYALKNLNLKFNTGGRVAVVGMNGSGKTTMIKLLCWLYDPTEGEITVSGVDIREYDYSEYTTLFSVVFQDFNLFAFSLGQNVAASVEYDRDKAVECLKMAGFGRRLSEMRKGLDTALYKDFEEDGIEISGGEAQKIALARALYKGAPFVVLDEPTAALDPIAEFEVYSKFNEIVGDKTAIYISHRLSSCRFCDFIAVFHEGELVQYGSHDELITDTGGKYYELWNAQAQYYTAN